MIVKQKTRRVEPHEAFQLGQTYQQLFCELIDLTKDALRKRCNRLDAVVLEDFERVKPNWLKKAKRPEMIGALILNELNVREPC